MRNCASYSILLLYYFNTLFKRVNGLLQLKKDAFKKAWAWMQHNAQKREIEFKHNQQINVKSQKGLDSRK
jgi:hypothetical protein